MEAKPSSKTEFQKNRCGKIFKSHIWRNEVIWLLWPLQEAAFQQTWVFTQHCFVGGMVAWFWERKLFMRTGRMLSHTMIILAKTVATLFLVYPFQVYKQIGPELNVTNGENVTKGMSQRQKIQCLVGPWFSEKHIALNQKKKSDKPFQCSVIPNSVCGIAARHMTNSFMHVSICCTQFIGLSIPETSRVNCDVIWVGTKFHTL